MTNGGNRRRRFAITSAGVLVAAVIGGVAWAAIPDANGTIHGCYKAQHGQLRVIDTGESCLPSEVALSWNQAGQQGATGPQGATGATGLPGNDSTKTVSGAINPDGTSQLVTDDFTSRRIDVGHYRLEFPAGTFASLPNIVVMPIGKSFISGSIEFSLGGGAFGIEYYTVSIDTNQLTDTLVNFIATPFTIG